MMNPSTFVRELKNQQFEYAFNPYAEYCDVCDLPDAATQRASLLVSMLEVASERGVDAFWIGRDLGHRGGRRTGMALTDDVHFHAHAKRWGISATRPTHGAAVKERTASVIWHMLLRLDHSIFMWNVFPFHPHLPSDPFSNRSHNSKERAVGEEILCALIQLLRPRCLVAIGNDAGKSTKRIAPDIPVVQVRHPSYGGQTEFLDQISNIYRSKVSIN